MCIGTLNNHSINLSKYINNIYNNNKIKQNVKLFFSLSNNCQTIKSTDIGTLQKINNNNVCMQWRVPIARHYFLTNLGKNKCATHNANRYGDSGKCCQNFKHAKRLRIY